MSRDRRLDAARGAVRQARAIDGIAAGAAVVAQVPLELEEWRRRDEQLPVADGRGVAQRTDRGRPVKRDVRRAQLAERGEGERVVERGRVTVRVAREIARPPRTGRRGGRRASAGAQAEREARRLRVVVARVSSAAIPPKPASTIR